jgi:integrase
MTSSIYKRCPCPPLPCPEHGDGRCPPRCTKRPFCPKFRAAKLKDAKHAHGSWFWAAYVDTSAGRKLVRRGGFEKEGDAKAARELVLGLAALATDERTRGQIGDMIVKATMRGGQLPPVKDVKRRLGVGAAPGEAGVTFGEAWPDFVSGNKRIKLSSRLRLIEIGEHWLMPVLADVPLERLNGTHCQDVFDRMDWINAEIIRQRGDGRAWIHVGDSAAFKGDVRERPKLVGNATQHRVFAALRSFCNYEVKVQDPPRMDRVPVYAVRLAPEVTPEAQSWTPDQAARFLAASAADELGLMFRIAVLCGARRGELVGFRWTGSDLDAGYLTVERPILLLSGGFGLQEDTPKSKKKRRFYVDAETCGLLREHRKAQVAVRLRAGSAWEDNDLVFCRDDGTPYRPDYVYRRFRLLAKDAGVPVIKLHEGGRHTAASLSDEAEVSQEIRQKTLGHATAAMTSHYTHIRAERHRAAAEQVAALVAEAGKS